MIIRSQDKRNTTTDLNLLIKVESRVLSNCLKEEFPRQAMFRIVDSKNITLGDYSTEEKAIMVLDMIAQNYVESEKYIIRRVFEMPQDCEV